MSEYTIPENLEIEQSEDRKWRYRWLPEGMWIGGYVSWRDAYIAAMSA